MDDEPLSYESRLKQISSTKFKGDLNTVAESAEPKQAAPGDTREFEYIESEIVVEEGIEDGKEEGTEIVRHQSTIKEEIEAPKDGDGDIDEYLRYQEAYRREQQILNQRTVNGSNQLEPSSRVADIGKPSDE